MRTIVLVSDEQRGDGQEGRLMVDLSEDDTGHLLGPTLERIPVMIPRGKYSLAYHNSENHPRSVMIMVPGRRFILIHPGGIPAHSDGCVLLGANDLEGAAISGGAPLCSWLADEVFGTKEWKEGEIVPGWEMRVLERKGDVLDGVLV